MEIFVLLIVFGTAVLFLSSVRQKWCKFFFQWQYIICFSKCEAAK